MAFSRVIINAVVIWSLLVPYGCRQRNTSPGSQSVVFLDSGQESGISELSPEQKKKYDEGKAAVAAALKAGDIAVYNADGTPLKGTFEIGANTKIENYIFAKPNKNGDPEFGFKYSQTSLEETIGMATITLYGSDLITELGMKPFEVRKGENSNAAAVRFKESIEALSRLVPKQAQNGKKNAIYGFLHNIEKIIAPTAQAATATETVVMASLFVLITVKAVLYIVGGYFTLQAGLEMWKKGPSRGVGRLALVALGAFGMASVVGGWIDAIDKERIEAKGAKNER